MVQLSRQCPFSTLTVLESITLTSSEQSTIMSTPTPHQHLHNLATQFIAAYNLCSTATPSHLTPLNAVFDLRTDACVQEFLPLQNNGGLNAMNNDEYRKFLEGIVAMGWEGMTVSLSFCLSPPLITGVLSREKSISGVLLFSCSLVSWLCAIFHLFFAL